MTSQALRKILAKFNVTCYPWKGKGTADVKSEEVVALAEEETTIESTYSTFSVLAIA